MLLLHWITWAKNSRRRWSRVQVVSRDLFHRYADAMFPGEVRLWIDLPGVQKADWLERAKQHVNKEIKAGKVLPYG